MMQSSAISSLGNQGQEHFLRNVADGVGHLVTNIQRLDGAAQRASNDGDESTAALLRSFADEEAAKVLILIDAVRCPRPEQRARARTLKRWGDHLWKGIYARACGWRPADFRELASYVNQDLQPFYLDGPRGVDWVFPNEIKSERERRIYVDLVQDITESGQGNLEPYWVTPEDSWVPPDDSISWLFRYRTSTCVEVALSLHAQGISTERGLQHVAAIWQPIDPRSMNGSELLAKVEETLSAVWLDPEARPVKEEDPPPPSPLAYWPFPLWPISEPADVKPSEQLETLRAERKAELERIHQVQGMKDPPPEVSLEKVLEMHAAYAKVEEETQRRADEHSAGKGGARIMPAKLFDVSDTAAWRELRDLWWGLSDGERVSLVALAWSTRDAIANWPASLKKAQEQSAIHDTQEERYFLGLGRLWLQGFRRWETPPDRMWVARG